MKKTRLFLLSLLSVPLTLLAQPQDPFDQGEHVIKKENLETFQELEITNGAYVTVQYAEEASISIIGYQHCIDAVSANVSSGRLTISSGNTELNCPVEVVIEAPMITDITLRDGGVLDMTKLTADTLFASVYNGGEIQLVAHEFLYAKVVDGGLINYIGNPQLQSDIVNSGQITQTDPLDAYKASRRFTAAL